MDIQSIKNRFGIIGNSPALHHALNTAIQVSSTDLSVLIVGESGVGKEVFSQIIHALSARKHNPFIAVNCGAIPEGTIDSELFGHEKGSSTVGPGLCVSFSSCLDMNRVSFSMCTRKPPEAASRRHPPVKLQNIQNS
ncbi:MAG: sigma 54-interacting transcriptional regulator, partial [Panacibacter sp.]